MMKYVVNQSINKLKRPKKEFYDSIDERPFKRVMDGGNVEFVRSLHEEERGTDHQWDTSVITI
jgi:hypothetical protein